MPAVVIRDGLNFKCKGVVSLQTIVFIGFGDVKTLLVQSETFVVDEHRPMPDVDTSSARLAGTGGNSVRCRQSSVGEVGSHSSLAGDSKPCVGIGSEVNRGYKREDRRDKREGRDASLGEEQR